MKDNPYKYLDYYTSDDSPFFFGRERETHQIIGEILTTRLLVLFSPSGSGKTSLILAGARPELERLGYQTVYVRFDKEPLSALTESVGKVLGISTDSNQGSLLRLLKEGFADKRKPLVIFIDQFEEFFTVYSPEVRHRFITDLAEIRYNDSLPISIILSIRDDYFPSLHEFRRKIPSINNSSVYLDMFTEEDAKRVIEGSVAAVGASYEPGLVDRIISDLKNESQRISPITLQIVCHTLWARKNRDSIEVSNELYDSCGGTTTILGNDFAERISQIPWWQHGTMARIFQTLKTPDNTKRYRSFEDIRNILSSTFEKSLRGVLERLSDQSVLRQETRSGTVWYEFTHDFFAIKASEWLQTRRKKERRIQKVLSVGIVLFLSLYLIWAHFNYQATLTEAEYGGQNTEIRVHSLLDPFDWEPDITTGIFQTQLKYFATQFNLKEGIHLSQWTLKDWASLNTSLRLLDAGEFLYTIGERKAGLDTLFAMLKDGDPENRSRAAQVLISISKNDGEVIARLRDGLKNSDAVNRMRSVKLLVKLGQIDDQLIGVLILSLNDQTTRFQAAEFLIKLGQGRTEMSSVFLSELKDQSSDRTRAAEFLIKLGHTDKEAVEVLLESIHDEDFSVKYGAALGLMKLGRFDVRITDAVFSASYHYPNSEIIQVHSTWDFGSIEKSRIFLGLLKGEFNTDRWDAADVLVSDGFINKQFAADVFLALMDQGFDSTWLSETQRRELSIEKIANILGERKLHAAIRLGKLGWRNAAIIKTLLSDVKEPTYEYPPNYLSEEKIMTLGNIGWDGPELIEKLQTVVKAGESNDEEAVRILGRLGIVRKEAIAALVLCLKNLNPIIRRNAIDQLDGLDYTNNKVLAALIPLLKDRKADIREKVAMALGRMGYNDDQIISTILSKLKDSDTKVRSQALDALVLLGRKDTSVVTRLINAHKDKDSWINVQAAVALMELGYKGLLMKGTMLAAIRNRDPGIRSIAATNLARFGSDKEVRDALLAALKDGEPKVVLSASGSLVSLDQTKTDTNLLQYLENPIHVERKAAAISLALRGVENSTMEKIIKMKEDSRPWVRLGVWNALGLIREINEHRESARMLMTKADSSFTLGKWLEAIAHYSNVRETLFEIKHITGSMASVDSQSISLTEFNISRCHIRLINKFGILQSLKSAFMYNPLLKEKVQSEMRRKGSEWNIIRSNWYLNDVLLKKR